MTEEATGSDSTAEAPVRPLPAAPVLQTLDLGLDAAIGMVCDIDDPDCVPGILPGLSPALTGDEDDV